MWETVHDLRYDFCFACLGQRGIGSDREIRHHAAMHVEITDAVGADNADAGASGNVGQARLQRRAFLTHFGKAGRDHHGPADPGGGGRLDHFRHHLRGHRDHRDDQSYRFHHQDQV